MDSFIQDFRKAVQEWTNSVLDGLNFWLDWLDFGMNNPHWGLVAMAVMLFAVLVVEQVQRLQRTGPQKVD